MTEAPAGPQSPPAHKPRGPRLRFLVVGVVLAVGLGVGLFSSLDTGSQAPPALGRVAPTFSIPALSGNGTVGLPQTPRSGRPAVLVFFASWCTPCKVEIPAIARTYRSQPAASRVEIIGIDGEDPPGNARAFVAAASVTFPVGTDPDYRVTSGLYYFLGDPDAVFVRSDGTIARIVRGPITSAQLLAGERHLG